MSDDGASIFEPADPVSILGYAAPASECRFGVSGSNIIGPDSTDAVNMRLDFLAALRVFRGFVRYTDEELRVKAQTSRYWAQRLRYRVEKDRKKDVRARHGERYPR